MSFRLLHVSDLHLGQRFHDQDRSEEENHALDQVAELCKAQQVDVVALAGDIFDTANPGAKETARYHRFLAKLVLDIGVGTVVVIAGNHDNASRIEGPKDLYEQCRIHTVGSLRLNDVAEKCFVPLQNRDGKKVGHALAIPYLRDADVRHIKAGEDHIEASVAHREAVVRRVEQLHHVLPKDLPAVVLAHAFCNQAKLGEAGDERPVQVGNLGTLPPASLAGHAAYLALGHLHRPQAVAEQEHWRYSGSLLPTGFDEIDSLRSVVIADVPDHGPALTQTVPLKTFRAYRSIAGNVKDVIRAVEALPTASTQDPSPWAKVSIRDEHVQGGLQQYLTTLAQARGWQLLKVQIHLQKVDENKPSRQQSNSASISEHQLDDILNDENLVFERILDAKSRPEEHRPALRAAFTSLRERCEDLLNERSDNQGS